MPIYEYECNLCNHIFEKKQRFNDDAIAECPLCEDTASRVFRSVPVIFKGKGFYSTDHCRVSSEQTEKSASKPKEPAGGESIPAKSN